MKADLKAKFLQHLNQKKQDEGFTLIELLVVIIIIGILSAIALSAFVNQSAKAKQSEAKTFIGVINRAQQVYYVENASFASNATQLNIGLSTNTVNYTYDVTTNATSATVNANSQNAGSLKSYAGGVVALTSGLTSTAACQTEDVTNVAPSLTLNTATGAACANTNQIIK